METWLKVHYPKLAEKLGPEASDELRRLIKELIDLELEKLARELRRGGS